MGDLRPFRGIRFNPAAVDDLSAVLCPPYDMVSASQAEALRRRSPFNAVNLELSHPSPDDRSHDGRYARTAGLFHDWMEQGVLFRESSPAMFLMDEEVSFKGAPTRRCGLMAAVRLESFDRKAIMPHEHTNPGPVADRLALLRAARCNFSPLMGLYRDSAGSLSGLLEKARGTAPLLMSGAEGSYGFGIRPISDPRLLSAIRAEMASRQIIIADGHHRYEAALRYSEELGAAGRVLASDAAAGYVLMSLVSMDDPGLLVLPYHRLLDGLSQRELAVLWLACDEVFEVDTVDLPAGDGGAAEVLEKRLGAESPCEVKIAALGPDGGPARLLTTRRDRGPATMGAILEQWDTWVLHNRVVDPALGANSGGARLSFTQDAVEAVRHARTGKDGAAFLMSPARMDLFEQTVKEGVRLPAKSTCFYPKLPAGLVINTLEGDL